MAKRTFEVRVLANPDSEDCLHEAQVAYVARYPSLKGWDLDPRWEDDRHREYVSLAVPHWHWESLPDNEK